MIFPCKEHVNKSYGIICVRGRLGVIVLKSKALFDLFEDVKLFFVYGT